MPKRLCPFNGGYPQMKTRIDMRHVGKEAYAKEVHEKTTKMLMDGAIQARKEELWANQNKKKECRGKKNIGPVFKVMKENSTCYYCKNKSALSPLGSNTCSYCNKNICNNNCSKDCAICGLNFCPSCCAINYDDYYERVVCVNCTDDNYMS